MKKHYSLCAWLVVLLLCAASGVYAGSWQLPADAASWKAGDEPSLQYTFVYQGYSGATTRCEGGKLYKEGENVALSSVVPARENSTFLGWQYGGLVYQPGDVFIMPAADVVLVPLWKQTATRVENVEEQQAVQKIVRDGSVYIIKDGNTYDVIGRRQ